MAEAATSSARTERKAILGGSFDPVHRGHLAMAAAARKSLSLNEVIFVPCSVSPFKTGTTAGGQQRLEMLRLAIADVEASWATLSEVELRRNGPSYSWQTVEYFCESEELIEWFWILGTDQWEAIEQWARPDLLRDRLHFIVLSRHGVVMKPRSGWQATSVSFEHPASSTEIRRDFESKTNWLTPGVIEYCRRHDLYSEHAREGAE
ncbi:MAG: nicotinate (nicotinamide) nucleotide adenylyltransferase [Verrucomicrobiota bacterium]